eukprot:5222520-Alexandrium_andersonii.AAC.1
MIPYTLANTAWSVAQLRSHMGETVLKLMPSIAEHSVATIREFDARQLANIAWAFATARNPSPA